MSLVVDGLGLAAIVTAVDTLDDRLPQYRRPGRRHGNDLRFISGQARTFLTRQDIVLPTGNRSLGPRYGKIRTRGLRSARRSLGFVCTKRPILGLNVLPKHSLVRHRGFPGTILSPEDVSERDPNRDFEEECRRPEVMQEEIDRTEAYSGLPHDDRPEKEAGV